MKLLPLTVQQECRSSLGLPFRLLRRSIGTTYILSLSGTINLSFTLSNVMTGGGPNGASSVLLQYMYTQGMRNANFGYAMAIAMIYPDSCNCACNDF